MREKPLFEELSERINEALRNSPAQDIEKNLRALLAGWFDRMDLVMREDFEVQKKLLEAAQTKLAELEARLDQLERGGGKPGAVRRSHSVSPQISPSRCTSGRDCRRFTSSGCPMRRCARRATACARP